MRQSPFKALENRAEEFGAYGFDGLHAFSNDFFDHDTIAQVTGGHANNFAVCVGGPGYALSLGIGRNEQNILSVDVNPAVAIMANFVLAAIVKNEASEAAVDDIRSGFDGMYDLDKYRLAGYSPLHLHEDLEKEIKLFGPMHWSHPQNYPKARERVLGGSIAIVSADINNEAFLSALRESAQVSGQRCGLLSLTNVHMYLQRQTLSNTLDRLPLAPQAQIVYSEGVAFLGLTAKIATGIGQYNKAVEDKTAYFLH